MSVVFVLNNDDKGLEIFPSEKAAIAAYEGIDVEESPCDFWNDKGEALRVIFTEPNKRSLFSVVSSAYHLKLNSDGELLINILDQVTYVEGHPPLNSIKAVREYLIRYSGDL